MKTFNIFFCMILLFVCVYTAKAQKNNTEYFHVKGTQAVIQKKYLTAFEYFRKSLSFNKNYIPSLLSLGKLYSKTEVYDKASLVLLKAIKLSPKNLKVNIALVNLHLKTNRISLARKVLRKIIKVYPFNSNLNFQYAKIYLLQNRIYLSKKKLIAIIRRNPNYYKGFALLGGIYLRQQHYRKALQAFKKAQSISPENPDNFVNIARIRMQNLRKSTANQERNIAKKQLELEEILISLRNAISYDERHLEANYLLGRIKYSLERYTEALPHFAMVLKVQPNNQKALLFSALIQKDLRQKNYQKLKQINPLNDSNNYLYEEELLRKYSRPKHPLLMKVARAHYRRGKTLLRNNQLQQALFEFNRAVFIFPQYIKARIELSNFYRLRKDYTALEKNTLLLKKITKQKRYYDMLEQLMSIRKKQISYQMRIKNQHQKRNPTQLLLMNFQSQDPLGSDPETAKLLPLLIQQQINKFGRIYSSNTVRKKVFQEIRQYYPQQHKSYYKANIASSINTVLDSLSNQAKNVRYIIAGYYSKVRNGIKVNIEIIDRRTGQITAKLKYSAKGRDYYRKIITKVARFLFKKIPFNGTILKIQGNRLIVNLGLADGLRKTSKLLAIAMNGKKILLKIRKINYRFLSATVTKLSDLDFIKIGSKVYPRTRLQR